MRQPRKIVVVDDFYDDPDTVRNLALSCTYTTTGSKHFDRSSGFINKSISSVFEKLLNIKILDDYNWNNPREVSEYVTMWPENFNGTFYKYSPTIKELPTHIHHDCQDWVAVVMLSPDCPSVYGTSFWEHRETQKSFTGDMYQRGNTLDPICNSPVEEFRQIDFVEYKYNRLLVYSGRAFNKLHMDPEIERIDQLFNFNEQ